MELSDARPWPMWLFKTRFTQGRAYPEFCFITGSALFKQGFFGFEGIFFEENQYQRTSGQKVAGLLTPVYRFSVFKTVDYAAYECCPHFHQGYIAEVF
jgi:hypothetical protein